MVRLTIAIILTFFSFFGASMVLATKYYEEGGFVNPSGYGFYSDKHFGAVVEIPVSVLMSLQFHVLEMIDHELFIHLDEYTKYMQCFMDFLQLFKLARGIQESAPSTA